MKEILDEIKEAEEEAEKIAEEATAKKQGMLQKARQDSLKLISEKEAELGNELKKEIDKKTAELDKKKNEIILKSEKEAELMNKKSKAKMNPAVDYIMEKFEESLG